MRIGIDIMGGDYAPEATTMGSIMASNDLPNVEVVFVGDESKIKEIIKREGLDPNDFVIEHTTQVVGMNDHPTRILSTKPDSSLIKGFKMLKMGELDAFCSAGNTGAMLVASMYTINAIPGVIRPCITSILPKENGGMGVILDVGANADCKPDVLYQFAILGSIFAEKVYGIDTPKVGLLNIGEEEEKGNLLAQATHELMKDTDDFNFVGNVEGRDLFNDKADVIVCDGFTGNVVLKEAESIFHIMKSRGIEDPYFERFNYETYGGTPVLGVNKDVVIGHGNSSPEAIRKMISLAAEVAEAKLADQLKKRFRNE